MDGQWFDDFSRTLGGLRNRRQLLMTIFGGLIAGGALGRRNSALAATDLVTICHLTGSESNPVEIIEVSPDSVSAHLPHGDSVVSPDFDSDPDNCGGCFVTCASGICQNGKCVVCSQYVVSGGPSPSETIGVDDDLTVYLNGSPFFVNSDRFASELSPIFLPAGAKSGDLLQFVATDVDTYCRGIDPLYLHCAADSSYPVQVLDPDGQADGCVVPGTRPPGVFYDQTFVIA